MKYLLAASILISVWFLAGSAAVGIKNQAVFLLGRAIIWPKQWLTGIIKPALTQDEQVKLKLENEALKAELFQLRQQNRSSLEEFLAAKIHTSYPFNDKSLLSVDLGVKDGVKKGMAATIGGSILLGQVEEVFSNYSLVKTIFSPGWQIPVRIGNTGAEGLLNGSANPEVIMISKNQKIEDGAVVFAAYKDFAYGIKIGFVKKIREGVATGVFKEATLEVPYNINDLTELWLIK